MNAIQVEKLIKKYDKKLAISDISFSVEQGEIFGLLGPNGAGKSTTINIITGLIRKDGGEVNILGHDLDKELIACKYLMGIVPQELSIYEDLSAYQNVDFFGALYGLKGEELKNSVMETLTFVGLADKAKDKVKTFSGGMKRRLNIACGLVHKPKVLILDEPTVGIDPQSRNHIMESIKQLNAQGTTIIYTTHYMEEAEQLCDRIAIMDSGQIVAQGDLSQLRAIIEEHWFIQLKTDKAVDPQELLVRGVVDIDARDTALRIKCKHKGTQLRDILDRLASRQVGVLEVMTEEPNLEDVFLTLTGKSLRD